jgi:hypothetical protein
MPTAPCPQVTVSGQPVTTLGAPYTIAGCAMPPPPAGNGPCVTGQWIVGATRVTATGMPLLLLTGSSVCAPTGTPMMPVSAQTRVLAT